MIDSYRLFALSLSLVAAACGGSSDSGGAGSSGGSGASAGSAKIWFEDVTEAAGIDFVHVRAHEERRWIPETITGGAAWLDYDGDGRLDLYAVQGGDPVPGFTQTESNRLYKNLGDGTFVDVTEAAGVAGEGYGFGTATGDYDGDGDVDLYVCNLERNLLFRNEGDGTFREVAREAGVAESKWSSAASFTDYDGDGDLDLFVVNYLAWSPDRELPCKSDYGERDYCNPINYNAPTQDTLYRNEGDGTFRDVTRDSGVSAATGTGLGLVCADYDGDGDVDVYVTNDGMPNHLWLNDGAGKFREEGLLAGCAVNMNGSSEAGMGVQAIDVEDDGDWDLFMTHVREQTNTFYLNDGKGVFTDRTISTGLAQASRAFTGFGLGFHDFDQDGAIDLFVANGRVGRTRPVFSQEDPFVEPNQVFAGAGAGRFEEVKDWLASARPLGTSRAAAFADYDEDGDVDIWVTNAHGPGQLLRNVVARPGRWIGYELVDAEGRAVLGARLELDCGGRRQHRLAHTSYSFAAANDPRVHFGLAEGETPVAVVVTWPGGASERFEGQEPGRYHRLQQSK